MADSETDLLMKFVIDAGGMGIDADCQTSLDWKDPLMWDFDDGQFFEVLEFGFGANLDDDEGSDAQETQRGVAGGAHVGAMLGSAVLAGTGRSAGGNVTAALSALARGVQRGAGGAQGAAAQGKGSRGKFQRWKSMQPGQNFAPPYKFVVDEFNFTRYLDRASTLLFDRCCNSLSFDSATLVKRKVTGATKLQAFLRMDFQKVLVTKLDWDDGEVIKEKCSFVYRGLKLQYMRQQSHGGLESARMPIEWNYELDLVDWEDDDG